MISVRRRALLLQQPRLEKLESAHLVGICGTGMKALAELLSARGVNVTGSDQQAPSSAMQRVMNRRGLRVHRGHHGSYLKPNVDVLVYSPAIPLENAELVNARNHGIPVYSYTEMLGYLMQSCQGICISGTHGKSTTTAMLGSILDYAQRRPTVVVGAETIGRDSSAWTGEGQDFVVESCEFSGSFLDLSPTHAAILSVEPDHFDCFETFDDTQAAFRQFAALVPTSGTLLLNGTCPTCYDISRNVSAKTQSFSRAPGADWWATDVRPTDTGIRFRVFHQGRFFSEIYLAQSGLHNVDNALAAIAMSGLLDISAADIRQALGDFSGLRRRFERVGSWRGMTLVDDYAHHPTAVRAALRQARHEFGERHIRVAFQPHQVSRTVALMDDFASAFSDATEVLVAPVFPAREQCDAATAVKVAKTLTRRLQRSGTTARCVESLDRMISTLDDEAQPGDVLVTMGAGDINTVHHEFTRRLQRNP